MEEILKSYGFLIPLILSIILLRPLSKFFAYFLNLVAEFIHDSTNNLVKEKKEQ